MAGSEATVVAERRAAISSSRASSRSRAASGLGPETTHRARAGVRHRAAVVVDRGLLHDRTDRVHQAPERVERDPAAGQHDRARVERGQRAGQPGRGDPGRQRQGANAGSAQHQLQRLGVEGIQLERGAGVEHEHAGGARWPAGASRFMRRHPAGGEAPAELVLRRGGPLVERARPRPRAAPPRSFARPSAERGSPRAGRWPCPRRRTANAAASREPDDGPSPR